MLPPEVRQTSFFAFNPKRLILDPIKMSVNPDFELVESIHFISTKVLDDGLDHSADILTEEDMKMRGVIKKNE